MQIDRTTLFDLSIFDHNEEHSLLHYMNFCKTSNGKIWLHHYLKTPLNSIQEINERQQLLQQIISVHTSWPETISNGSVLVIEKFYESQLSQIPSASNIINASLFKVMNAADYSLIKYSINHFTDFVKGMSVIYNLLKKDNNPSSLHTLLQRTIMLLQKPVVQQMIALEKSNKFTSAQVLYYGHFIRNNFKDEAKELIEIHSRLDAYYSLATACKTYHFSFPQFSVNSTPLFRAQQLYHPLLTTPVSYNISLIQQQNFLFLTGANMAGKSTFIKAVGVGIYLAHLGMAVPAAGMQLSYYDGLISNIHVIDNIVKGESYFYNEVQRIHKTIEQITNGKNWIVLIDELFKGTNIEDAMKCSLTVIEGLRKINTASFILSTHLYEIGETLKQYSNIQFKYFETMVKDDQLFFNYILKEGISNDRLGYLILKKEGVVDLLEKL